MSVRFGHFLRCCHSHRRVRATASDHNRHNAHARKHKDHSGNNDHATTPKFAHLFVGLNGVSGFFPGRLVGLLGDGAHKHVRLKHVSLVGGFSFFRMSRGRTRGIVGTLGQAG